MTRPQPAPGDTFEIKIPHDGVFNLFSGELWKVDHIDPDGDVWVALQNPTRESRISVGEKVYFSLSEFQRLFGPTSRAGRAQELERQIEEREAKLSEMSQSLERDRAALELMRRFKSDGEEAVAIWRAIADNDGDVRLIARALGLESLLDKDATDERG